jgi:hypothetical protein
MRVQQIVLQLRDLVDGNDRVDSIFPTSGKGRLEHGCVPHRTRARRVAVLRVVRSHGYLTLHIFEVIQKTASTQVTETFCLEKAEDDSFVEHYVPVQEDFF